MKRTLRVIRRILALLLVTAVMASVLIYACVGVCIYGPSQRIGDMVVMSASEASFTRLLLPLWLSRSHLEEIVSRNEVHDSGEKTDTSLVKIEEPSASSETSETNPYIVSTAYDDKVETNSDYELHYISGGTWSGIMMLVKDPSRVFVGTSKDAYDGSAGLSVVNIAKRYNALAAVNGAFFEDTGGVGNGGTPLGFVFSQGAQLAGGDSTLYRLIGFNTDNVLVCGTMTGVQAKEQNIRDALSCKPFLVVNGEPVSLTGSGSGLNPRTAIGQRADGVVCLLVIDGRQTHSLGASLSDLEDIMIAFGAVNAGNLDGGGSTALYLDGNVLNNVTSIYGMRPIPDAICVRKGE